MVKLLNAECFALATALEVLLQIISQVTDLVIQVKESDITEKTSFEYI